MADQPNPKSYEQILSDALSSYASKMGLDDFVVGSAVTSIFEVFALSTARASGDVFQILRDNSIDRATGDSLKRLATENKVTPLTAKPATGPVTVIDISFSKISTKVYAGSTAPNIGSVQIKASDASAFPASGSIYIGRGTSNVEGPIPYSSITPSGGLYLINLSAPTSKFHNVGESIILAQGGNRVVPVNTLVLSPSSGASPDIQFKVRTAAIILDGETQVEGVQISAQTPGASGNVPRGAIREFASPPFSGATVSNPLPFTTGSDNETDDQLRVRIKRAIASKGLGTAKAVKAAAIGASPSDEQATVVSDEIVSDSNGATLYIDDNNGYEAKTAGVGLESIVDSALGGEQYFQLATGGRQAPVAKAFLQSTISAPFDLVGGDTLSITVGEQTFNHTFSQSDFLSPGGVTAFEISASINANTTLGFEATTSGGGQYVVVRSKEEGNDSLKIATPITLGRDASVQLGFPSNEVQTLRLYKNKIPLNKDGKTASIFTESQQLWSPTIANGDTLILSVDGTDFITYTINNSDFINTGLYTSVSPTNSLDSWAEVLNNKLTGVTVTVVGQQLKIASNLGAQNRAVLEIDNTSTLVTKGMFNAVDGLISLGKSSDLTFSRNTAQIKLTAPLVAGDELSSGSKETEARIQSEQISGGSITFASDAHVWILVDNFGQVVTTGVVSNSTITVTKPSANIVRYTSNIVGAFSNVQVGDYLIVWSEELNSANRLEARINAVTGTTLDILVTATEYAAAVLETNTVYLEGFVVLRSTLAPQKFRITAGNKSLDQISEEIQLQSANIVTNVLEDEFLTVKTTSKEITGSLMVVTADDQGKLLNLPVGTLDESKTSLIAFYDSELSMAELPLFVHSGFAAGTAADPIDSYISNFVSSISLAGRDPNDIIAILQPYGAIRDSQPYQEIAQISTISGPTIGITEESNIRRLRTEDRYYIANPIDFGSNDSVVVILDNDTTAKTFEIPLYRKALTNTGVVTNPNNFNAYDVDSGPTAGFSSAFGSSFSFDNFKVLMRAKKTLKPTPTKTALLYRATKWGRSGEKINVGYVYPTAANLPISSTISATDEITVKINLKSSTPVSTSISDTTEWNVTITSNTPVAGVDQVTYTWNGIGTAPALILSGGEYVNISAQSGFSLENTGIFRVSTEAGFTPTATSFSVQRATGSALSEINIPTLVNGSIIFYNNDPTTAAEINTYVNANLSDYFTTTIVSDGGIDGSGIVDLSTYEDSDFTFETQYLLDGINWILSTALGASPQFIFKNPLSLPSDVGYAFNDAEEIRLIPTTIDQLRRLISVLAVTGFTTAGSINEVSRSKKLELSTNILGSSGSIQVVGGLGNLYGVEVLDAATRVDNNLAQISVNSVASQGVHSDQWFRLEALTAQRKQTLLSSNTSLRIFGNDPAVGQSTIKLLGRTLTQRYLGKPRHHVRPIGRNFRVEKQGKLTCLSWDGVGSSPIFSKPVLNLDDSLGGTLNITKIVGSNDIEYIILAGNTNFNEVSIGDLITVSSMSNVDNNGTFLVTGISSDGTQLRVLNPNGQNEYSTGTFTFTGNSTPGDAFTVGASTLIADTDFVIGATQQDTAANLSAQISTLANVVGSVNGSVVTVTATIPSANIAISYVGTAVVTVSGAALVGPSFVSGNFSASSSVAEGDSLIIGSPFASLNQGTFRVIRCYNNSVWYENENTTEEEVTLPTNLISLGFDGTTQFDVNGSNNSIYLNWNGTGTEPSLGNAHVGDILEFGTDFSLSNRGEFMVVRSGVKLQEITDLTMPSGAQFTIGGAGKYFLINSAGDANQYYVWFNVNGSNSDPAPVGPTGIPVAILSGDNSTQVATAAAAAINAAIGMDASSALSIVTAITTGFQETTDASNFNMPAPFAINVTQQGRRTFLECVNPSAVTESAISIADVLICNRPQMSFLEYEAAIAGDSFVATGDTIGLNNAGSFVIERVVDQDTVIVSGSLSSVALASMNGKETSIYIQEGIPYYGYKKVLFVSPQPGAPGRSLIAIDTNAQYEKINQSASVSLISLNKLNFNTIIRNGLDSYRYNTGLIAEVNRIIYGDPRDPATYPGVGAAGAEIFVREPLTRRIQISAVVRLNTGVPFPQIVEQVRTSISSLVNSNPVGQPIAISAIISAVNAIPGVKAMAISSPQYDSTHDLIYVAPSEKARIIDATVDVSVSQIGT